jgi:DNA-binding transcriptional ArsR family regulator
MAKLKQAGLLIARKEGQWIHYSLKVEALRNGPLAFLSEIVSIAEASADVVAGIPCCE